MNIALTACRVNIENTVVSISFSDTENDTFRYEDKHIITNSNKEEAVIFHIKNECGTRMANSGSGNLLFSENFTVTTDKIRVFYWNDSECPDSSALQCMLDFFNRYGLDENAPEGSFECPYPPTKRKEIVIPRQAGNGGVVRIVDIS